MPITSTQFADALDMIQDDIKGGFDGVLDANGSSAFQFELDEAPLASGDVIATTESVVIAPWVFRCTHSGTFLGVPATFVELELRGTTFVHVNSEESGNWLLYRYIDYLGALHQMGASTVTRPALMPDEYENWLANRAGGGV